MRLPIFILLLVVSLCTAASAQIFPPVTPVDMYPIPNSAPARIAADSAGKIYVTDPYNGLVYIYTNNGMLSKTINKINFPIGIAVDSSGKIYISDSKRNFVGVYSDNGDLLYKFGSGNQEFKFPNAIAIYENESTQWVFVSDSKGNEIRKYSIDGTFLGSFGADLLGFPTGITVDKTAEELYVLDHNNVALRIYDLNGNLKRSITAGGGMFGGGKLLRPLGIAVDSEYIYIADAYHSVVAIYSKGGMYLKYFGTYGSALGEFIIPSDIALDKDGKMFVTNTDNQRIEVLGINNYTGLKIEPDSLNFNVIVNGSSVTQSVNLTSVGTETSWTATKSASWISVSADEGNTPSVVNVTVNPFGLSAGNYSSDVVFKTPSGTEYVLKVNAEAAYIAPAISISPSSLNFKYYIKSDTLQSDSILISSNGPIINWNAKATKNWLMTDKTSGITPDSLKVSLTEFVKKLDAGSYNATVVVDAGAISGSPAIANVNLEVINPGTIRVITNLDGAGFFITGPENHNGSGKLWTEEKAKPGQYEINFTHVSGYKKPYSRSFTVKAGNTVEINGIYTEKPLATHLIAGSGNADGNLLKVIPLNGGSELSFPPFDTPSAIKVSAGDMDGDGIDEIIVTNGKNIIKVYNAAGNEVAVYDFKNKSEKLEITIGDIDNDGKAEIIAGYIRDNRATIIMFGLDGSRIIKERLLLKKKDAEPFSLASGDVDGDGMSDIIMADRSSVSAFKRNAKGLSLIWNRAISENVSPVISAGDINNDGFDEILLASGPDQNNSPLVRILKGDGTDFGLEMEAFSESGYRYGANAAASAIESEGTCSVAVGAGPGPENEALISLYNSSGEYIETIRAMESLFGVNVSFGKLEK